VVLISGRINRNLLAITPQTLKLDDPFNQGEQGVILAATHIVTGVDLGTTLTIDDVTGLDQLTTEFFAAKPLAV
jgi:hypothetical protein